MRLARIFARTTLLGALLVGMPAAYADKGADKPKEVPLAEAKQHLDFFTKFAATIIDNKADCKKMAGALNTFVDANAAGIQKAREIKEKKLRMPKKIEDEMIAKLKEMVPAIQKCQSDAEVKKALERAKGDKPAEKAATK